MYCLPKKRAEVAGAALLRYTAPGCKPGMNIELKYVSLRKKYNASSCLLKKLI